MISEIILVFIAIFLYPIARPQRKPADESNRINKVILMWFGWTRPELFDFMPLLHSDAGKIRGWVMDKLNIRYDRTAWHGKLFLKWDVMHNEQMFAPHFKFLRQDTLEYMRDDF